MSNFKVRCRISRHPTAHSQGCAHTHTMQRTVDSADVAMALTFKRATFAARPKDPSASALSKCSAYIRYHEDLFKWKVGPHYWEKTDDRPLRLLCFDGRVQRWKRHKREEGRPIHTGSNSSTIHSRLECCYRPGDDNTSSAPEYVRIYQNS